MAPSATETTTLPSRTAEVSSVKLAPSTGAYKELSVVGYEKEAELEGKDGFTAATVRFSCSCEVMKTCSISDTLLKPSTVQKLSPYMGQ